MNGAVESSFRDPSGFLFKNGDELYRQVNLGYKENFDNFMSSGLYEKLVGMGLLVSHTEVDVESPSSVLMYKVIKPELVPFISYPYEWSFTQLKDAALATLEIQKLSLELGMSLKDASAFNIQFYNGRPTLIDTLSFEIYKEGQPWVAYKQFCQHFLAPLLLMSYTDVRLSKLFTSYIDGIPLDLASRLLPATTKAKFSVLTHIHFHSKSQQKYADKETKGGEMKMAKIGLLGLIDSLEGLVKSLKWQPKGTEWGDYYTFTNYTDASFEQKKKIIGEFIDETNPAIVWDLGANNGIFSRIASDRGVFTVSSDIDPAAVEKNYLYSKERGEKNLHPLLIDLTNPSPAIGWGNAERDSFVERGPADMAFALALIHHISISNNVPFNKVAQFMGKITKRLVIEFVPKSDSQVKILLKTREDIFSNYDEDSFERDFSTVFNIVKKERIEGSERTLYLMEKK